MGIWLTDLSECDDFSSRKFNRLRTDVSTSEHPCSLSHPHTADPHSYGHTGNMPGYTLFAASTPDGTGSVVVAANSQISSKGENPIFKKLLAVQNAAICAATGKAGTSASPSQ